MTVLRRRGHSRKAEQIRGEGDAERNRIFAEAFGRDPDFFAFYRSMQAYEAGLRSSDTRMLLKPGFGVLPLLRRSVGQAARRRQPPGQHAGCEPRRAARDALARTQRLHRRRLRSHDGRASSSRIGLVLVIEGLLFAAFPARREAAGGERAGDARTTSLRIAGHRRRRSLGVVLIWVVRG